MQSIAIVNVKPIETNERLANGAAAVCFINSYRSDAWMIKLSVTPSTAKGSAGQDTGIFKISPGPRKMKNKQDYSIVSIFRLLRSSQSEFFSVKSFKSDYSRLKSTSKPRRYFTNGPVSVRSPIEIIQSLGNQMKKLQEFWMRNRLKFELKENVKKF